MRRFAAVALAISATAALALADLNDTFFDAIGHTAIQYHGGVNDPVAALNKRIAERPGTLRFESTAGYLRSLLQVLDVPVESQIAVFSKTSLQAPRIEPSNPRAIYFNDSVAVAWMNGGMIEVASQDPRQGIVFYKLLQQPASVPTLQRDDSCLSCHKSDASLSVPGMMVRSMFTATDGRPLLIFGGAFVDQRTPVAERWGGYYVTGNAGPKRHMGNMMISDDASPAAAVSDKMFASLTGRFETSRYLAPYSDVAALMVFDHQMHMMNLLTRIGWETRVMLQDRRPALASYLKDAAREVVDYMLFIDEAPLDGKLEGTSGFGEKFVARGPADSKGRSLRQLDLTARTMRYPCSYMIYSPAFDALPTEARDAIYRRMSQVLSGQETDKKYSKLTKTDRQAILEILRETKKGLPDYLR